MQSADIHTKQGDHQKMCERVYTNGGSGKIGHFLSGVPAQSLMACRPIHAAVKEGRKKGEVSSSHPKHPRSSRPTTTKTRPLQIKGADSRIALAVHKSISNTAHLLSFVVNAASQGTQKHPRSDANNK
jgi:hypothetical protein